MSAPCESGGDASREKSWVFPCSGGLLGFSRTKRKEKRNALYHMQYCTICNTYKTGQDQQSDVPDAVTERSQMFLICRDKVC